MILLDCAGLEAKACECSAAVVKDYAQIFDTPVHGPRGARPIGGLTRVRAGR